jgi:hypothetical protein
MHLMSYLQHYADLLFFELEVQSLVYVYPRILWIYYPNLFPGILNYSEIPSECREMTLIKNAVSIPGRK